MNVLEEVGKYAEHMIALRRDIHAHPELGWKEYRTQELICKELDEIGLPYEKVCGTGVIAVLKGTQDRPVIGLRADMDALPVTEKNICSYTSQTPGVMHACGHDCHTAILLTAARILCEHREEVHCTIKFIFQPAEEVIQGGKAMSEQPQLADLDHIFGAHVWSPLNVNSFCIEEGPRLASADNIYLTINGLGAHGAEPHRGHDAIIAACAIVQAFQSIVSRNTDPLQPLVITIGTINGGTASNIIPAEVRLSGTVRSFSPEVRDETQELLERIAKQTAETYGCTCVFDYQRCTPATINAPAETKKMRQAVIDLFGEKALKALEKTTGGEDFAWYLEKTPGAYMHIGARNDETGKNWPQHHECYDVDEQALVNGAAVLVQLGISI